MIEDFAKLIPKSLMSESGNVFASGRHAFEPAKELYILSAHPGGMPEEYPSETVASHTDKVLKIHPEYWSSYRDGQWGRYSRGQHPTQKSLLHLFDLIKASPEEVPASVLIFQRSRSVEELPNKEKLASECWPFHQAVIDNLGVRVIVCLGKDFPGKWIRKKLDAQDMVDSFTEDNKRGWTSLTYRNNKDLQVVVLTYPIRSVHWTNPATDPTGLVLNALERTRNGQ